MKAITLIDFGACTCIWLSNLGTMDYMGDECHTDPDLKSFALSMLDAFQEATDSEILGENWDDVTDDMTSFEWIDLAIVATYTVHQQKKEEEYLRQLGFIETKRARKKKYPETSTKAWMITVSDLKANLISLGIPC